MSLTDNSTSPASSAALYIPEECQRVSRIPDANALGRLPFILTERNNGNWALSVECGELQERYTRQRIGFGDRKFSLVLYYCAAILYLYAQKISFHLAVTNTINIC